MFTIEYKKKLVAPLAIAFAVLVGASPSYAYTVQKGDTMSGIAQQHGLTLAELAAMNPQVKNLNLIYVGDNIATNKNNNNNVNCNGNNNVNYTAYEKDLLERLVEAEAGVEPYKGKVAVANVVLNRVKNAQFPDTIYAVIHAKNQFTPVANGTINKVASEDSKRAVQEALSGVNYVPDALYFYDARIATSRWLDGLETTNVIGNHTFKR